MSSSPGVYLRADIDLSEIGPDRGSTFIADNVGTPTLTFVDLYTSQRTRIYTSPDAPSSTRIIERLTAVVQDRLHLLSSTDIVLFRWPWLVDSKEEPHTPIIDSWLARLVGTERDEPVIGKGIQSGVIQHRIGARPIIRWADQRPSNVDSCIQDARAIELHALLQRSNAIWEPRHYHYRLPSGEHTDVFIRVADALHSPQDTYVLATWLSHRLANGTGIVVDTGGLTPLLIQLQSFLTRHGLDVGPMVVLSEYPIGRSAVRQAVENAATMSPSVMCILSVSSTGSLLRTLVDELERLAESSDVETSIDLLVNRSASTDHSNRLAEQLVSITPWLQIKRTYGGVSQDGCDLCKDAEKAQCVGVDPRTYGSMALPGPHLVMPNRSFASASQLFWSRVAQYGARAIEASPAPHSRTARGKRIALPVKIILESVCQPEGLANLVKQRLAEGEEYAPILPEGIGSTGLVVVEEQDVAMIQPPSIISGDPVDLKESLVVVLRALGINPKATIATTKDLELLQKCIEQLANQDAILAFAWGSITGLNLRHLKLAIADALGAAGKEAVVNGLVFHSRPSTPPEWKALQNQFQPGSLESLWSSYFPWFSPLADEERLLDNPDLNEISSATAREFLVIRRRFLALHSTYSESEDDWSPRFDRTDDVYPEHVFWGMSRAGIHQKRVRGRSLYGRELDCVTAYAAIGSVLNYTRQCARPEAAPRWVMFDLGRIVRSYFDAVITCSILRWLEPGELWWGGETDNADRVRDSVRFLLDQPADETEEVLLVPEVLLASAQGKVPRVAHNIVRTRAQEIVEKWPQDRDFALARGAVELGLELLEMG